MSDPRFTRVRKDSQSPIRLHLYDEAEALSAWSEYQALCIEELALRDKRKHAHQRFVAAFTADVA